MAKPRNLDKMSIEALVALRETVATAISQRASELQKQLSRLTARDIPVGWEPQREGRGAYRRAAQPARRSTVQGPLARGSALKGRKIAARYRSRKDPTLTWAGRGMTPRWMREEMKGGKLSKDAFLIRET
jgi:DNA-binding protein H-NS